MLSRFNHWLTSLRNTRPRFPKRRGSPPTLAVEVGFLESRVLLSASTWTGGAGDGQWSTANNWSGDVVPAAGSTVTIDAAAGATIHGPTTAISIASLTLTSGNLVLDGANLSVTGATTVSSGQSLTINSGNTFTSGTVALNSGTLNLGGILKGTTVTETGTGKIALQGTSANLDGATINGNLDLTGGEALGLWHTVTVNGTISLGAANGSTSATLYLGDGTTNTSASLVGNATIVFGGSSYNRVINNVAGGTATLGANVVLNGASGLLANYNGKNVFLNQGTIDASVSGGTITVGAYGNGTFQSTGKLEATGGGSLLLQNNLTITGGITGSGAGGVTLQGTMNVAASTVAVTGSMTVNGGTITNGTVSGSLVIGSSSAALNNVTVTGNIDNATFGAYLTLLNTVTLNGTLSVGNAAGTTFGIVLLGDGSTATAATLNGIATVVFGGNTANGLFSQVAGGTATLGVGVTVEGKNGTVDIPGNFGSTTLAILGTVNASVSGGTINVGDASNTFECTGTLTSASGASLNIHGRINIEGKTVTLAGPVMLNGATFENGTIATSGTGELVVTSAGASLINVTVNGNIDAATHGGSIGFQQTVTLNGTLSLGNSAGTTNAILYLGDGSTNTPAILNGNATIVFGGSNNYQNKVLNNVNGGTATLAATVVVEGDTGSLDNNYNTNGANTLVVLGTVNANVGGGIINIGDDYGSQFQVNGTLTAANGGFVGIDGPVSLAGGALSNTAPVLLGDDFSGVNGGELKNGTVNISGTGKLETMNGTLDDVIVNGNIDEATYSSSLSLLHTVELNGTLSLGNAAGSTSGTVYLGDGSTSTTAILAGNATVVFGGEGNGNNTFQANAPAGKSIIGGGVTLEGKNGWVTNQGNTDTLENLGTVFGSVSGGSITFGNVFDSGAFINRGILEGNVAIAGNETGAAAAPLNVVSTGTALLINGISNVSMGSTRFGTPISKTFTVTNYGDAAMTVQPVTVPTGFTVTSNFTANQTIAPDSFAQFTIQLAATAAGTPSGTVTIPDNDTLAGSPFKFTINGSVSAAPHIVVTEGSTTLTKGTSTVAFGNTTVGTPITQTITVTNTGDLPLIVQPVTVPAGFAVTSNFTANQSIAVGGSANFTIQFNPSAAGAFSGVVTIGDNDTTASPFTFNVSAAAVIIPTVTVNDPGGPYTGNPYGATATATGAGGATVSGTMTFTYYIGNTVSGTGTTTAPSLAGTYTVVASFTSGNSSYRNASSAPVTFTITKATPTVTAHDAGGPYTGSAYSATSTATGVGGATVSGTTNFAYYTGSTTTGTSTSTAPTNVGTYTVVAAFTSTNSNYANASSPAVTFTIKAATPTLTVTDAGGTYSGIAFPATAKATGVGGATVSGTATYLYYTGSSASGTGSTTAPTNVGTYTVVATFTSTNSNYSNASSSAVTFTIAKATPTVQVSDWGGVYTGKADAGVATVTGAGGVTLSGTTTYTYYSGSSASGTGSTTAPTNAGTYTVVATFTSTNSNYGNSSSSPLTFVIEPAIPTITITGTPLAPVVTVTGINGAVVTGTTTVDYYTGTSATGTASTTRPSVAGTYTIVIVFTSKNSNFSNASSAPVTFTFA